MKDLDKLGLGLDLDKPKEDIIQNEQKEFEGQPREVNHSEVNSKSQQDISNIMGAFKGGNSPNKAVLKNDIQLKNSTTEGLIDFKMPKLEENDEVVIAMRNDFSLNE